MSLGVFANYVENSDIFAKILFLLSMKEMAILRQLCRQMKEFLPTYHIHKFQMLKIDGVIDEQDQLFIKGPVITRHIHRLYIHLKWHDQGWGNRKTKLMFYLKRNGTIIADWYIHAVHEITEHKIIIDDYNIVGLTEPGDLIEVWTNVGAGGGHAMRIKFMTLIFEVLS